MDWITILTAISGVLMAFGGIELVKWIANRRSNSRQSEAEADQLYLCTRDSGTALSHPLSALVGLYVEKK